ncbi:nitrogen fixation protein FixI (coupling cation pump) [Reticulomyxa filosa]|uniref:Nitrogen fixation protein FixI (Coupling cation pump) n=1 Tax=Reticulomyxa filosa TaxID=46433 RepID=X6MTD9_RETFI|nr:nitrogen fixation protein FixI (coupling cation pump) [Reticulomyxa filosa]|eukprot:ETO16891.1 nitrogen fixation protein FixI (coupling cation pump) [Reticulomyxa filosa]
MKNDKCLHCNSKISKENIKFCCFGCESAFKIINALNLNDYYSYCKTLYNTTPMKVQEFKNELNYQNSIKHIFEKQFEINLLVEGIQCGSCIWLIEKTLKTDPLVTHARVNLSTNRLHIAWNGEKNDYLKFIEIIQKLGYKLLPVDHDITEDKDDIKEKSILRGIAVSGFATVQLMMIVMGIWFADNFGSMGEYTRKILHLFSMIIAIPCIIYSGSLFFKNAFSTLKAGRNNMDVPISIGIIATTLISIEEFIRGGDYTYFDSATMLILALLIGRSLDIHSRHKAREKARQLILQQSNTVTIFEDGKLGAIAFVSVGEKIPVDGVILEGKSEVDNSLITGETTPINVAEGDYVYAGTVNLLVPIKIRITKFGDSTVLGEIIKLIEIAEQGRAKYVMLADRIAGYYTPVVLLLSALTFIGWLIYNYDAINALLNAVAVLIITCPCALGLAVPIVQIIASSRLMERGILLKSQDALEKIANIKTIVFDKTGTLTYGKLKLINSQQIADPTMQLIASLAAKSKHPISIALRAEYDGDIIDLQVDEIKGMGLSAKYKDEKLLLGSKDLCNIDKKLIIEDGVTEIWFKQGEKNPIRLLFSDEIRNEAKLVIDKLKSKYNIWILSGDKRSVVTRVANGLGIENYTAEIKPQEKYDFVSNLEYCMMVGDGLNDSAALKKAYVSMSPSSAIDIAQNNADIIYQKDLFGILETIEVAFKADQLVKQNLSMAILYNIITIPIAILGYINPMFAAIAMSLSSLCVIINSLRLNRK